MYRVNVLKCPQNIFLLSLLAALYQLFFFFKVLFKVQFVMLKKNIPKAQALPPEDFPAALCFLTNQN